MKKNKYDNFDEEIEFEDEDNVGIEWAQLFNMLYTKRRLLIITAIITLIIAIPAVLTVPKYYTVEVKLAPELSSESHSIKGGISSLLSNFGLGSADGGEDAIGPLLYPDLMNSNTFLVSLFDIPVVSKDNKIRTTYYNYLFANQKEPIWTKAIGAITELFPDEEDDGKSIAGTPNAAALTKEQTGVAMAIKEKVTCDVDKKTGVITIDVKDQDPYICATVANSACKRLQQFITEYRSKKAKQEMLNVEKQYKQSKIAYEVAKQNVESFNDSNWDLVDEDMIVQKQDLENKMQLAFQTMTAFNTQLMNARSKYQSSLPVYTVLDGASVPIKPTGPKRSLILLGILILVLLIESGYIILSSKEKLGLTEEINPQQ